MSYATSGIDESLAAALVRISELESARKDREMIAYCWGFGMGVAFASALWILL